MTTEEPLFLDNDSLKQWFANEKRELPWRQAPTPYAVWISEVMLQQTQVSVVLPYFIRWMQRFPSIQVLAEASLDEVIKEWEGLGYYSRARCLHEGSRFILEHFNGELPCEEKELNKIKGLGPYTIGAILSLAFHQKKAAVDGNVLRVLARYFHLTDDIAKPKTVNRVRQLVERILPEEEPWITGEALIELGAVICQRKPRCQICPLQSTCKGFLEGAAEGLPIKTKAAKTEYLYRAVSVLRSNNHYLVKRGEKGEIMSDLYEFPFFETTKEGMTTENFQKKIKETYQLQTTVIDRLPPISQSFTRYHAQLFPVVFSCLTLTSVDGFEWLCLETLKKLAFSSGHRHIFRLAQAL